MVHDSASGLFIIFPVNYCLCLFKLKSVTNFFTFQGWIFEHFPTIDRVKNPKYKEKMLRGNKWHATRGKMDLKGKREQLDKLKATDVIWCPYGDHRAHSPSQPVFLYSGFIRHDKFIHPHLPERELRQLGGIQGEPNLPPAMKPTCDSLIRCSQSTKTTWLGRPSLSLQLRPLTAT